MRLNTSKIKTILFSQMWDDPIITNLKVEYEKGGDQS